jgi:GTP-binding protein YchF
MSINTGIVGLAQSGKTTLFNALTGGKAETAGHAPEGISPHIGVAKVPEPRLRILGDLLHPLKLVPVEARYTDVGASVKTLAQDKGLGGRLLNQISSVDTLICVIRAFPDNSLPHHQGSFDVIKDIETLNLELVFSDLTIMDRRLDKLETSLKGARSGERAAFLQEKEVLLKLKTGLENERPLREIPLGPQEAKFIVNYQFLTAKPLLIVVNIGEEQLDKAAKLEEEYNKQLSRPGCRAVVLCCKLEMELAQMEEKDAEIFRQDYGLTESGLEHTIRASYELSDLVTFFTIVSGEVRAWAIKRGTTAVKAAGKIHGDMEKGFIRAESIAFNDLVGCGSIAEARKKGVLRLEGKDYVVKDGDVITILFNV